MTKKTTAPAEVGAAPAAEVGAAPEVAEERGRAASVIVVYAQTDGYRRAGRTFGRSQTRLDALSLSAAEIKALTDDTRLTVRFEYEV